MKLYNKAIVGLPESDMCDITKTEWADLYQYFDYLVTTFGSNE